MDNARDLVQIGTMIVNDQVCGSVTDIIGGTVYLDSGEFLLLADITHEDIIGE